VTERVDDAPSNICRTLLVGANPEDEASIAEWLARAGDVLSTDDVHLDSLNTHLLKRSVLVGQKITLADLMVYGAVHDAVAELDAAKKAAPDTTTELLSSSRSILKPLGLSHSYLEDTQVPSEAKKYA
jgi:hypothetical protein